MEILGILRRALCLLFRAETIDNKGVDYFRYSFPPGVWSWSLLIPLLRASLLLICVRNIIRMPECLKHRLIQEWFTFNDFQMPKLNRIILWRFLKIDAYDNLHIFVYFHQYLKAHAYLTRL